MANTEPTIADALFLSLKEPPVMPNPFAGDIAAMQAIDMVKAKAGVKQICAFCAEHKTDCVDTEHKGSWHACCGSCFKDLENGYHD